MRPPFCAVAGVEKLLPLLAAFFFQKQGTKPERFAEFFVFSLKMIEQKK
jgi:hypothetical protein